ncbi:hypothetical protein [Nocardia sp. NPDC050793]|uniref:hypothetical protein n=1 Tax=Nocardia sp. NPDC050793 TaxID=3155159 RepID=UPI003406357B
MITAIRRTPVSGAYVGLPTHLRRNVRRPGRRRSAALDQLGMVEARLIEGELEEARRIGHAALQVVEQTASDRVAKKVARVYNRTGRFATVGAAVELRERMRPLVAATA